MPTLPFAGARGVVAELRLVLERAERVLMIRLSSYASRFAPASKWSACGSGRLLRKMATVPRSYVATSVASFNRCTARPESGLRDLRPPRRWPSGIRSDAGARRVSTLRCNARFIR